MDGLEFLVFLPQLVVSAFMCIDEADPSSRILLPTSNKAVLG